MDRSEVIRVMARAVRVNQTLAELALDALLNIIVDAVTSGDPVRLRGFGSFHVVRRAARAGRNPRTGELVSIPVRRHLQFTPARILRNLREGVQE